MSLFTSKHERLITMIILKDGTLFLEGEFVWGV